jgi:hypothetical protein
MPDPACPLAALCSRADGYRDTGLPAVLLARKLAAACRELLAENARLRRTLLARELRELHDAETEWMSDEHRREHAAEIERRERELGELLAANTSTREAAN